eukprot:15365639-Ditylum_brightwellii.AAC.3
MAQANKKVNNLEDVKLRMEKNKTIDVLHQVVLQLKTMETVANEALQEVWETKRQQIERRSRAV